MTDYLKQYGQQLLAAGYEVLPIKPGAKRPPLKNWELLEITPELVDQWLANGNAKAGVGVRTAKTPAVDLDIRDQETVDRMVDWCQTNIGQTVVRIGQAPKTLLVYRTDKPFTKLSSKKYVDWLGQEHRIEILGQGQQFVSFAIHPDTGRPYEWIGESIADIPADRLPVLTAAKAAELIAYFEATVPEDWELVAQGKLPVQNAGDADEAFLSNYKAPSNLDRAAIEEELQYISPDEYETWVQVGMALHHQYQGWHEGWEVWDNWSQLSDKYVGSEQTEAKWDSFKAGTAGVTIGTVFFLADKGRKQASRERMALWESKLQGCNDYLVLMGEVAPELGKMFAYDPGLLELFAERLKKRAKEITGAPVRVDVIRKAMNPKAGLPKVQRHYDWLEHWTYDLSTDRFFHLEEKTFLSEKAFNAQYDRLLLTDAERTEGNATPANRASMVALNDAAIPTVSGVRYMPGAGDLFLFEGQQMANRYKDNTGAQVPAFRSPEDKEAIALFKAHLEFLIEGPAERTVLLDFLTYIVQNPGKRVKWAVMLQGPEGNGKSYLHGLMGKILGPENVSAVAGKRLEGQWTDWAEGNILTCIEEIKFQGHNRFDALNSLKPYITNEVIEVTRKHQSSYQAPNTTSYLMFTNFQDAMPLDRSDSRYYVIFSRLKTTQEVQDFVAENPVYFSRLFEKTFDRAGAIKGWLLERELSEGFNANKRAPDSAAKAYMIELSKTDDECILEELLEDADNPLLTEDALSTTELLDLWKARHGSDRAPQTSRLNRMLIKLGWQKMVQNGQDRVKIGGRPHRVWTKFPGRLTFEEVRGRYQPGAGESDF